MNKTLLCALLLCGLSAARVQAQTPALPQTTAPAPVTLNVAPLNAQMVFDEGARLLKTFYFGFSPVNLDGQINLYRLQLNDACAGQDTTCPLDTGESVLDRLYRSLNDRHLYAMTASELTSRIRRYESAPERVSTYGLTLGKAGPQGSAVLDVLTGSVAEQAGIVPGDVLVWPQDGGFMPELNSQPSVTLTLRHGMQERQVTLTRTDVLPVALPYLYRPADAPAGVLVLRIPSFAFTERVGPKVHELVKVAQTQGAAGLIVDLRRGPGGSNYECEMAAAAFTGPFSYLNQTTRGDFPGGWLGNTSSDEAERAFFDMSVPITQKHLAYPLNDPARWTGKVVALVDQRSASCHEYMAFFMQQAGIPVIGQKTFGLLNTGSLLMPLPGGGAVAIPAVRAAFPDGTVYPAFVTPDEEVPSDPSAPANGQPDPLMQRAYERLK